MQSLSKMPRNTSLQLVCCVFVVVSLITTLGSRGSGLGDVCPKDRELHAIPEDLLPKYSENPGTLGGICNVCWWRVDTSGL